MKPVLKRTERGWPGHFIGCKDCQFRRNTLIEYGRKKIVVSTVGAYFPEGSTEPLTIGYYRFYETMAFRAMFTKPYWEADIDKRIVFESQWQMANCTRGSDMEADKMHETVVKELMDKMVGKT